MKIITLTLYSAIRIGFEQPSYTFIEPPFMDQFQIFLTKEDHRLSEQAFNMTFELFTLNVSDLYQSASLGEDFIIETVTIIFHSFTQRVPYNFILLPDDDPRETETFYVSICSNCSLDDQFPTYFPPNSLSSEASIVIIDTESMCILI